MSGHQSTDVDTRATNKYTTRRFVTFHPSPVKQTTRLFEPKTVQTTTEILPHTTQSSVVFNWPKFHKSPRHRPNAPVCTRGLVILHPLKTSKRQAVGRTSDVLFTRMKYHYSPIKRTDTR
eukprot:gene3713-2215_t